MKISKVSVTTLGCKSNQYDSSAMEDMLRRADIETVPFPAPADAYIINTCTVTARTDAESRALVRRVRRLNPDALVIVTGCYAQVASDEVARTDGVDYVLGNQQKADIIDYISRGRRDGAPVTMVGQSKEGGEMRLRARSCASRTRATLKIQDGCDRHCSYCIIPRARGASRSLALEEIERELDMLVGNGFKEIVLTGIHLGAYGTDLAEGRDIAAALGLIEKKTYPCRFRISSLDPDEVTDELIEILRTSKRICNHVHLALQSGDNSVIKAMKRDYTRELFAQKVELLARNVPGVSIGADVIAGFPGEGSAEFDNTLALLSGLPVAYLHVFPFSKRRGTLAAALKGQVPASVIKKRCARLNGLDRVKRYDFYARAIGSTACVIVEGSLDKTTGLPMGKTSNYIPAVIEGGGIPKNTLIECRITRLRDGGATAGVVATPL